jgi:hypothetical protein
VHQRLLSQDNELQIEPKHSVDTYMMNLKFSNSHVGLRSAITNPELNAVEQFSREIPDGLAELFAYLPT